MTQLLLYGRFAYGQLVNLRTSFKNEKEYILHFLFLGQHALRTRNDIYCISFQHIGC